VTYFPYFNYLHDVKLAMLIVLPLLLKEPQEETFLRGEELSSYSKIKLTISVENLCDILNDDTEFMVVTEGNVIKKRKHSACVVMFVSYYIFNLDYHAFMFGMEWNIHV